MFHDSEDQHAAFRDATHVVQANTIISHLLSEGTPRICLYVHTVPRLVVTVDCAVDLID